jgi:hypothetical protein
VFVISAFAFKGDNTNDNLDKNDTKDKNSHFCGVCNITFVKSSDLKSHKSMMHQKVGRIETNDDNIDYLDESDTEHESDFHQQKLKEMSMEIGSENEDSDYFPENDELPDEQGNLTKGFDNKTVRT